MVRAITAEPVRFAASRSSGEVSGLLLLPPDSRRLLVLAHGAGAGMHHAFMEKLAARLGAHQIASLRYQFPYTEKGLKRPDPPGILTATVRAAVGFASEKAPGLPLIAGGKSMGGRMTSQAAAEEALPGVRGLVFFGFPLHAPGKPSGNRADHLDAVTAPMLFLQGTRDTLADLDHLKPVVARLGSRRATLHIIDDADHSFHVPKRSGRTDDEVMEELAATTEKWATGIP